MMVFSDLTLDVIIPKIVLMSRTQWVDYFFVEMFRKKS